ncbi:hypothetical protein MHYP_G00169050 [Metynnis hypsauchen]
MFGVVLNGSELLLHRPSRTFSMFLLIAVTAPGHCATNETLTASVGDCVALPCKIPHDSSQENPSFRWRHDSGTICEINGDEVEIQAFEGRAEVSKEKLAGGDCSLILLNVTESNSGNYGFFKVGKKKEEKLLHKYLLVIPKDPTEGLTTAHQDLLQQNIGTSSAPDGQHSSGGIIAGSVVGVAIVAIVAIVVIVVILAVLGIRIYLRKCKTGRTPGGADDDQDNGASIPLNDSGTPQN